MGKLLQSIGLILALNSSQAFATTIPQSSPDVRPITRSSTEIFDIISQLIQADLAYVEGDFEKSFTNYLAVSLYDPENKNALLGLGKTAIELEKYKVAFKAFKNIPHEKLSTKEKQERSSGLVLAETALGVSQNVAADINRALLASPQDKRLWVALAKTHETKQAWLSAREALKNAKVFGLGEDVYFNYLGQHYSKQKKYIEAAKQFKQARRLNPNVTAYDRNLRFAYLLEGQYFEALKDLPDSEAGNIFTQAGKIAISRGDYLLAEKLLRKAIKVSPRYNQSAVRSLEWLEANGKEVLNN